MSRAGVVLALLYAVVALVTSALSSRPVLPLFDGFAPPVSYNWVTPPASAPSGNTVPKPFEREFPLGPEGSDATNASSEDAQVIVGLDKGSVAPRPPDAALKVAMVPLDAATLGPLPAGLRPVSNAYQVVLTYLPSGVEISQLAVKGTVSLTAVEANGKLLYSPDGARWQERQARPFGTDNGLFSELDAPGYFVVASPATAEGTSREGSRVVQLGIAAAVPIIGAVLVLRLPSPVRAPEARTIRRPPAKRPRPAARKKARRAGRKPKKRRRR